MTRHHKYNAVAVTVDGHRFPSKREAKRYGELKMLERAGKISDLNCQPRFAILINGEYVKIRSKGYPNGRRCSAVMDFDYSQKGKYIIEDVKSAATDTPVSKLKRALVEAIYGVEVRLV